MRTHIKQHSTDSKQLLWDKSKLSASLFIINMNSMFFLFLQTKVRSKLLYCHIWTIFNWNWWKGNYQNFYIFSLKHIILHWEKIINSETRFLQRFIMVNIDILCPLESHAFEIIPVTLRFYFVISVICYIHQGYNM